jgi:anti-sigma regulatory factor (Ser/Thr protein kinase)
MSYLERRFLPQVESAAAARRFVCDAVSETGADRADVVLLTSELVNNAILHAHSEFDVCVNIGPNRVRVSVVDHAPERSLVGREPSADGGRGLALIDAIANSWGFESQDGTKLVWFQLACKHAAASLADVR